MIFDDPVSVRNNNPGNIRSGKGGFKKFSTPEEGLKALRGDLLTKVNGKSSAMAAKFGKDYVPTLRNLINTWAPPNENDTDAYINHVVKATGLDPDATLGETDVDAIIPAMVQMEGGNQAVDHFTLGGDPQSFALASETAPPTDIQSKAAEILSARNSASSQQAPLDRARQILAEKKQGAPTAADSMKNAGEVLLRQGYQGMTGNLGDEAIDALGAGIASIATDEPYDVLFDQARDLSKQELASDLDNSPVLSGIGNLAGGVLTAGALAGGVKSVAPRAANAITNLAKSAPKTAAAIAGAGSGGVYGAGQAEGTLPERLDDAGGGAMWGVPLGVGGYKLAQGLSKVGQGAINKYGPIVSPYLKSAKEAVSPIFQRAPSAGGILDDVIPANAPEDLLAAPQISPEEFTPMRMAGILDEGDLANLQQGRALPLTKGDRTQDVKVQRMEQIAAESGSEPMLAARAQQQAAARKPFENVLGVDVPSDPMDLRIMEQTEAENAANALRGSFDSLKGKENAAWKQARDTGEGVGIRSQNIQDGLVKSVDNFLAENQYRAGDIPALDSHMTELRDIMSTGPGREKVLAPQTQLKALEAWKTRLNSIIGDTPMDKQNTSRILKNIGRKYDDFMTNIGDDAIVNGDETAIKAFKEARLLSRERFGFQDSDKAITRILDSRDLSGEQLVNVILGAEKLSGKGQSGRLIETMLKHSGDQSPQMQEAIKRGIMAKSFRRALTNTPDPSDTSKNLISFDKMRNEIGGVMAKKEIFSTIFDDTEQQYMRQLYDDLKLVAGKQKGAVNNSSTGILTADMISGLGKIFNNPLFRATPVMGAATNAIDSAFQKQAAAIVTGKAEKGLGEFMLNQINNLDAGPAYYGAISANSVGPEGIMKITVRPSDKKARK